MLFRSILFSQTEDEHNNEKTSPGSARIDFGADLVSRYIWRGSDYGNSPSVQPNIAFSVASFKIGVWGSYGLGEYKTKINDSSTLEMGHYAEFDLFASYTFKWFTIGITDYFFPNGLNPNIGNRYYDYKKSTTSHLFEASLSFNGTEKLPLQVFVGTMFYGNDPGKDSLGNYSERSKNNYSTYLEASYTFSLKKTGINLKPFIGGIPCGSSIYGSKAEIVNLGLTVSRSIKISNDYSLPVTASVITNPGAQNIFIVFGITI